MNTNPQDMTFIQIDLETLSRKPNAVVASLGAVAYNRRRILTTLEIHFDLTEQIEAGRHIQGETIVWWMDQSDEARKATFTNNIHARLPVAAGRDAFCNWYSSVCNNDDCADRDELYMMSMGNDFDLPIITDLFGKVPWHYQRKMCWRTLYNLYRGEFTYPDKGVKHSAIDDAYAQCHAHMQLLNKYPERLSWVKPRNQPAA